MLVVQILLILNIRVKTVIGAIYLGPKVGDAQDEQTKHCNRQEKRFHRIALLSKIRRWTPRNKTARRMPSIERKNCCA
jgi:hypothetical protein